MDRILKYSTVVTLFMLAFTVLSEVLDGRLFVLKRGMKVAIFGFCILAIVFETLMFRTPGRTYSYELSLFWSYRLALAGSHTYAQEIVLNILLYMPLGFILPEVFEEAKPWQLVLFLLVLSGMIESIQLITKLGLFEFDDIFNNILGGVFGIGCSSVLTRRTKL
jgi:glycopeptide antibiotics resistance protein